MKFAKVDTRSAYLFSQTGESIASQYFTKEQIETLGRYGKRSKHAGKLCGVVRWSRLIEPGLVIDSGGKVAHDGRIGEVIEVELCTAEWGKHQVPVARATEKIAKPDEK